MKMNLTQFFFQKWMVSEQVKKHKPGKAGHNDLVFHVTISEWILQSGD